MTYLDDIQKFGELIENSIEDQFDIDEALKTTNISKFHFYRLFRAVIGLPIYEYIKRRKIYHAAQKLLSSSDSILDIAIQYGFTSQEVFIRNFKKYYGDTPAKWRKTAASADDSIGALTPFDIKAIKLDIKSYNGKVYIEERILVFGKRFFIGIVNQSSDNQVETITDKIERFLSRVNEIEGLQGEKLYRICYEPNFSEDPATFMEFIGVCVDRIDHIPKGMIPYCMDASAFIGYTHKGPLFNEDKAQILHTYDFIYKYRLATSGYRLKNNYFVEIYGERFYGPYHEDSEVDILLSIVFRQEGLE